MASGRLDGRGGSVVTVRAWGATRIEDPRPHCGDRPAVLAALPEHRAHADVISHSDSRRQCFGPHAANSLMAELLEHDDARVAGRQQQAVSDQARTPSLVHRMKHDKSILALAVSSQYIFAGTQGGEILVYSLDTYELRRTIEAHRGSVLSLTLSQDQSLLFSSATDPIVNVSCAAVVPECRCV